MFVKAKQLETVVVMSQESKEKLKMSRNKGISTIQAIKCRTIEIPFFVIPETNQPSYSVRVENTALLFCRHL